MHPRLYLAHASALWAALFGLMHVLWIVAYFCWPAFGTATLGPEFMWAFGRRSMQLYDLFVAVLFGIAAVLAYAVTRQNGGGVPRRILKAGLLTAGILLFLRGAAGVMVVALALVGAIDRPIGALNTYDFVFLLGGCLFLALAITFRRAGYRLPIAP